MSCPTMSFSGVTREVYDCLIQQARSMGFPAPKGPSGIVAYHNVEAEYRWDEDAGTLAITITRAPAHIGCASVESSLRQAIRGCGGA
ncbi:MAG TPA: hypothetical protein VGB92_04785 [Longimicrobium sp.]